MKYVFSYLTTLKYDCSSEGFIFIGLVKPVGLQGPVTSVDVSKFPCPSQVIDSSPEAIVITGSFPDTLPFLSLPLNV